MATKPRGDGGAKVLSGRASKKSTIFLQLIYILIIKIKKKKIEVTMHIA